MAVRGAAEGRGTEGSCLPLPLALPVPLMAHSIPLQINFFIFIRIIQILVSKLRAHQMRYTDYKFRWVLDVAQPVFPRCTGTCVHPVTPVPQAGQVHADPDPPAGHPRGGLRLHHRRARPGHPALRQALLRPLPELLPGEPSPPRGDTASGGTRLRPGCAPHTSPPSSQGMLVAILYCFVNKEVSRTLAGARAAGPRVTLTAVPTGAGRAAEAVAALEAGEGPG